MMLFSLHDCISGAVMNYTVNRLYLYLVRQCFFMNVVCSCVYERIFVCLSTNNDKYGSVCFLFVLKSHHRFPADLYQFLAGGLGASHVHVDEVVKRFSWNFYKAKVKQTFRGQE